VNYFSGVLFLTKLFLIALLLLIGCKKAPLKPLDVEAYVWQSAEKPAVREAMTKSENLVSRLHVRAAELRWQGGKFVTEWFIKKLPAKNCGLVVRIGASASALEWTPTQVAEVAEIFKKTARFLPSEIQCDFDCPQKRLKGYSVLLDALQSAVGAVPVLPTALPSWLDEPEMARLVKGRASWVLQVHSLELPSRPEESPVIFDVEKTRVAALRAARLGVPFRIAMATYGCEVRFNEQGKVIDVVSEDFTELSADVRKRSFAMADPVASAGLVAEWEKNRPAGLMGIIWYRLPVEGDARNWPWATLQLVARGQTSSSQAVLEASSGDGARDLTVANHGDFPVRLPRKIIIRSAVVSGDGSGNYHVERVVDGVHFHLRPDVWPWLDPCKNIACGWIRCFDKEPKIDWYMTQ
jgi:Protein of unknown function (DUF3142)